MKVKIKSLTVPEEELLMEWARSSLWAQRPWLLALESGSDPTVDELMTLEHMSLRLKDTWRVRARGHPRCSYRLPLHDSITWSQSSLWSKCDQSGRLPKQSRRGERGQRGSLYSTNAPYPRLFPQEISWRRSASLSPYPFGSDSH